MFPSFGMTLARSNVSRPEKSSMMKWYENVTGESAIVKAADVTRETAKVFRQGSESLAVGGLLGAAHAGLKTGLDVSVSIPGVKTPLVIPGDLATGIIGLGAAVMLAGEGGRDGISTDLRNAGATGLGIFGFRKGYDFVAEKKRAQGLPVAAFAGERMAGKTVAEDKIVVTARTL